MCIMCLVLGSSGDSDVLPALKELTESAVSETAASTVVCDLGPVVQLPGGSARLS